LVKPETVFSVFTVHTNTPGRRPANLNDAQFGYFGHLQMMWQHQMMCDVMKTTLLEDTSPFLAILTFAAELWENKKFAAFCCGIVVK
jgi:hypothetical protein